MRIMFDNTSQGFGIVYNENNLGHRIYAGKWLDYWNVRELLNFIQCS